MASMLQILPSVYRLGRLNLSGYEGITMEVDGTYVCLLAIIANKKLKHEIVLHQTAMPCQGICLHLFVFTS